MQLQQEHQISKLNLLRKRGLLAHTSAAFLKNCCIEKLFGACGSFFEAMLLKTAMQHDLFYGDMIAGVMSAL